MGKKFTALIPVRKGSQRVLNKNIKPFGNSSLLEIKINVLKTVSIIDEIIVNSDCEKMLSIAKKMNVSVYKRQDYYSSSTVNNSVYFKHIAQNTDSDYIMYAPVTCPFIKSETYINAIEFFLNNSEYDSLASVFPVKHHMWLDNKPLNYKPENSPNSQDLPDIYGISYGISIIEKNLMIKRKNVVGYKPYFFKLDEIEAIDIDTELEFQFAEFLYNKINST